MTPTTPTTTLYVLNDGYVRLVNHMGDELELVNDLKASFAREAKRYGEREDKLLMSCFRRREFSAWRHHVLKFEVRAPLFVANQLHKYSVGSAQREDQLGWNELSRRYVTQEPALYVPAVWRAAPDNKKQGSGPALPPFDQVAIGDHWAAYAETGLELYHAALVRGCCPEQARAFLPAYFLYTNWRWTMSLNTFLLVMFERLAHEAQHETVLYARALRDLGALRFPRTVEAILGATAAKE